MKITGLCRVNVFCIHVHTSLPDATTSGGVLPDPLQFSLHILLLISGDSTGLTVEGITGRVLLILTDVITILVFVLFFVIGAFSVYEGKYLSVHLTTYMSTFCCMVQSANLL